MMGMPSCKDLASFAHAYHANELDPQLRQKIDKHLVRCSDCANFLDSYKKITQLGEYLAPPPLDAKFAEMIQDYLKTQPS